MALILPTISISLKAPVDLVIWVPLVSLLVEAAFMPTFGNFSDKNGRRRYFIAGLLLFAAGSLRAGNSQTIFELLIYRIIQSFGSAFILANGRALIVDSFGPEQRGFALGTHVSSIYVAMTIGTAITGSIVSVTQLIGWRYVFYVSGGIALASIPLSFIFLRESKKNPEAKQDWPGALLFAAAITSSLVTIAGRANSVGSIDIYVEYIDVPLAMLAAGIGLFAPNHTNANLSSVPPRMRALTNGILGMMLHTGQSLSLALSTALLGLYLFGQSPQLGGTFDPAKYISALQVNFVVGAAVASLGILVSLRSRKRDAWESDRTPSGSSLSDDV